MEIFPIHYLSTNYYLLRNGKARLLVDAGWPGTFGRFRHILREKDVPLESIAYFLVTHFHPDHAGLVQELKEAGLHCIVLKEQLSAIPLMRQYIKQDAGYKDIRTDDLIVLEAGQSRAFLKQLNIDGVIVRTPGHSDDSVTLVLDSGEAFTGDLPPTFSGYDNAALEESLKTLQSLGVTKLYPGHGPYGVPFNPS